MIKNQEKLVGIRVESEIIQSVQDTIRINGFTRWTGCRI